MHDHVVTSHDQSLDGLAVTVDHLGIHLKADDEKIGQVQNMENSGRKSLVRLSQSLETLERERIEIGQQAAGRDSYA